MHFEGFDEIYSCISASEAVWAALESVNSSANNIYIYTLFKVMSLIVKSVFCKIAFKENYSSKVM